MAYHQRRENQHLSDVIDNNTNLIILILHENVFCAEKKVGINF